MSIEDQYAKPWDAPKVLDNGGYGYNLSHRRWGIDLDGVVESTSGLMDAINASNSSGTPIIVPPDCTILAQGLEPKSNVHWLGGGWKSVIKLPDSADTDLFNTDTYFEDWGLENLRLDGNKDNQTAGADRALWKVTRPGGSGSGYSSTVVHMKKVHFYNAQVGMYQEGPGHHHINSGTRFENCNIGAWWLHEHINMFDTYFWNCGIGALLDEVLHQQFLKTYFAHGTYGILGVGAQAGSSSTTDRDLEQSSIIGCHLIDLEHGVFLNSPSNVRMIGNRLQSIDNPGLKFTSNPSNLTILGNDVVDCGQDGHPGIEVSGSAGRQVLIGMNTIRDTNVTPLMTYGIDTSGMADGATAATIGLNSVRNPATGYINAQPSHYQVANITESGEPMIAEREPHAATVGRNSAQTIPDSTWTAIELGQEFDTEEDVGTEGMWSSSDATRVTVGEDGIYMVEGQVTFDGDNTGARRVAIYINGSIAARASDSVVGTDDHTVSIARTFELEDDDYIELYAYQDSGGDLDTNATGGGFRDTFMSVVKVQR